MSDLPHVPKEPIRVGGLSDDEQDTLNVLIDQLNAKLDRNILRTAYYDAKRALRQMTSVVPPQYNRLGITLGWSSKAVDLLARRCNLEGFIWPDGDLDSLGYREVYEGNMLGTEVNQGLTEALIQSTAFVVTTAGAEGEPESLVQFLDATQATGTWNARARRLNDFVAITARDDESRPTALALYLDGLVIECEKDAGWSVVNRTEHEYGMLADPLPYKPRLRRPFGSSRITRPVMGIQDQAVRELIRLEGHMDVYSYPEFWLLGADASVFKNQDGSIKAPWQVMLGRLKAIPDDDSAPEGMERASVQKFDAASPEPHLAGLNAFAKLFARETSLPDTALAITDVSNPTSAESYDASQYELIAEAEGATGDFTAPLRRAMIRSLAMLNGETEIPDEWRSIDAKWRNPRFLSRSAEADAGLKQLQAEPRLSGTEVGLELLGLTEQQRTRVLSEWRRQAGSQRLDALIGLAGPEEPESEPEPTEVVPDGLEG